MPFLPPSMATTDARTYADQVVALTVRLAGRHANLQLFFHELLTLREAEDSTLIKLDCYKNVTDLVPLRKNALHALAACNYVTDSQYEEKIINILFRVMESNKLELQETAFQAMKQFISGIQIDNDKVQASMRPILLTLDDHRNMSLTATKRLSYFTEGQKYDDQHQAGLIIYTLMKLDDQWVVTQVDIVDALKLLWNLYKTCKENIVCNVWHLVGKILLSFFSQNTNGII